MDILRSSILIATHLVDLRIGTTRRMQPSSPFLLDHTQGGDRNGEKAYQILRLRLIFPSLTMQGPSRCIFSFSLSRFVSPFFLVLDHFIVFPGFLGVLAASSAAGV
jgi:hypothetical protein